VSFAACFVALFLGGCGRGEESAHPDSVEAARQSERLAAARAGLEWLVDHADEMPTGWAHSFLLRLHRVAPDDATAARIESVLRDDGAPSRRLVLPADLNDPRLLDTRQLTPILFELRRRKAVGEPYEEQRDAIGRMLETRGADFWSRVRLTQRGVYLHLFPDLGLPLPYDFEDLFAAVEASVTRRSPTVVAQDRPSLYAATHLVLVESGYFRVYVDSDRYGRLIPYLLTALDAQSARQGEERALDISAEILTSLALLRYPDDETMRLARARIISAQRPDGSWGEGEAVTPGRVHATLLAVLATSVLPDELRGDPDLSSRP
jgi:hypothetical protein